MTILPNSESGKVSEPISVISKPKYSKSFEKKNSLKMYLDTLPRSSWGCSCVQVFPRPAQDPQDHRRSLEQAQGQ